MQGANKIGQLLVSQGLLQPNQIQEAIALSKQDNIRLGTALIRLGHVNENVYATFLSKLYGIDTVSLDNVKLPRELIETIPKNLCQRHGLVPIKIEGNRIYIAVADPSNMTAVDDVQFLTNLEVSVYIAPESAISHLIDQSYGKEGESAGTRADAKIDFNEAGEVENLEIEDDDSLAVDVEGGSANEDNNAPVIRMMNLVFAEAAKRKCSDIHIEPGEDYTRVRFRVDGSLYEVLKVPASLKKAIPARIKVMSNLDISEKRLPQDGRIQVKAKAGRFDVRVSILPTVLGEKVCMRLLDQGGKTPDLVSIGFEKEQYEVFKKAADQPYGMILVTGPTGSGKSTTLYAALSELNGPDVNISTVEDPVEYRMAGMNQVQMKSSIGLTFASALRSLLRQDPDVIMVGEIRDTETAEIAVKAALTGHLVFSTLHTNDAPSTITRLVHMGIEPFLITASLSLVQAQRLIRVICPHCKVPDTDVTREQLIAAEMPESWLDSAQPMKGKGCEKCGDTGYKGRRGIFEVMGMSESLRDMVVKGANADELKKVAMRDGMITLRQSALIKLYRGETTLEDVLNNSRPDGDL